MSRKFVEAVVEILSVPAVTRMLTAFASVVAAPFIVLVPTAPAYVRFSTSGPVIVHVVAPVNSVLLFKALARTYPAPATVPVNPVKVSVPNGTLAPSVTVTAPDAASITTASLPVGTLAPGAPPLAADQIAVLLASHVPVATKYRVAT